MTDTCTGCKEPASKVGILVGTVCYDCAVLCKECHTEPADPSDGGICPECKTNSIATNMFAIDRQLT